MPEDCLKRWWKVIRAQTKGLVKHGTRQKRSGKACHAEGQVCLLFRLAQSNQISFHQVDSLGEITDCLIHPLEFKIVLSLVPYQGTVYLLYRVVKVQDILEGN